MKSRLTTLPILEDLTRAAGLGSLRNNGWPLGYFVLCSRKLDVELLLVDGLPECPHGALELLLHLLAHTVNITGI